jgi:hypothetical protein
MQHRKAEIKDFGNNPVSALPTPQAEQLNLKN